MSKDIWHTTNEKPMLHRDIILCGDGWSMAIDIFPETVNNICWKNVEKWCYLDDLLALETELDRTRKALEQSEICCTEWEKEALDYKAENIALSGDLDRTRKALDVAVDALKRIKFRGEHSKYECCKVSGIIAQDTINKITAEQKESAFVHNKIEFPEYNDNLLEEFDKQFFENGQDDDIIFKGE